MRDPSAITPRPAPLTLGIPGFAFADLYRPAGLRRLSERFEAKLGNANPTFKDVIRKDLPDNLSEAELRRAKYKLKVIASDITSGRMLVLPDHIADYEDKDGNRFTIDEFPLVDAVRMSMSFPFFFDVVTLYRDGKPHYIVDGGLLSNFPVWLFDSGDRPPRRAGGRAPGAGGGCPGGTPGAAAGRPGAGRPGHATAREPRRGGRGGGRRLKMTRVVALLLSPIWLLAACDGSKPLIQHEPKDAGPFPPAASDFALDPDAAERLANVPASATLERHGNSATLHVRQLPDLEAGEVTYHDTENLAVAVDTDRGLMVPAIHNAGDLNIAGLAKRIADLAQRTRDNKLKPDEVSGGTFTLTHTGSRGALFDTPIFFEPQVAILGTGTVVKRPVVVNTDLGETIAIRHMMYLALSYDHRLIDGADAARFLTAIKQRLEAGQFEADLAG